MHTILSGEYIFCVVHTILSGEYTFGVPHTILSAEYIFGVCMFVILRHFRSKKILLGKYSENKN